MAKLVGRCLRKHQQQGPLQGTSWGCCVRRLVTSDHWRSCWRHSTADNSGQQRRCWSLATPSKSWPPGSPAGTQTPFLPALSETGSARGWQKWPPRRNCAGWPGKMQTPWPFCAKKPCAGWGRSRQWTLSMFSNWRRTPPRWRCWRRSWQPWLRPWEPCRWQSQPWQHHIPPRQLSGEDATDAKRWVTWPNTARRDKVKGETRSLHCQMPNSGGWVDGSTPDLREQCPETLMEVDGKAMMAVIDTGSEVSTVTKSWFDEHLRGRPLQQTSWLSVKVANGLDIPYVGLLEGRIRVFGQECHASILVIKDTACPLTRSRRRQTLALLGMNILQQLLPTGQKTPPGVPPS